MAVKRVLLAALGLGLAALGFIPHAAIDQEPPGTGDAFFIDYMTLDFHPATTEEAARSLIPMAHKVCDARAKGQSDLQAAQMVWAEHGDDLLGVDTGSVTGDENAALDIVNAATLAYCPQYNTSDLVKAQP